ncbi:CusA/CzcA family heavy metal efflux RND transporter [soil metagenome]
MSTDRLHTSSGPLERVIRFAIQHRVLVVLLGLAVAGIGIMSLKKLPIDAVPDITNNQVQINTVIAALGPSEVEKQVTYPVETALAGIRGLQYTRSISRNGFSQVTAVFDDNVDVYFARQQVAERLLQARENLPDGAEPLMGPVATGLGEVYMYVVEFDGGGHSGAAAVEGAPGFQSDESYLTPEGDRLSTSLEKAAYLRTVQDWIVAPQLKGVAGVAGVDTIGGYEKQYHVQPDPSKLLSHGFTFHDIIQALERNNVSTGAGYIESNGESYTVRTDGRVRTLDDIKEITIGVDNGTPILIREVADVVIGKELRTGSASMNGREVVVGTALMLLNENSRTVAAAVDTKLHEVRRSLPPDVTVRTVINRKALVDATIHTVVKNLAEGAALVIFILFLMLGNIRAAIIAALTIPLSMLIATTAMVRYGISGNLLSLGAIDFGIIIDGAVIIVENCLRCIAERQRSLGRQLTLKERLHEVFDATKQMIQPSVFGQAIIVTVYLPILALTGVEGKMFNPMAMTVIFALIGAFVLSLTFVPAMVALCITGKIREQENFLVAAVKRVYDPALTAALRFRFPVVIGGVIAFIGSVFLFSRMGQEFIPSLDEGDFAMHAMRIPSTGITQSSEMQLSVEKAISSLPEVDVVFSKTGTAEMASDPMPPNVSDTFIILKEKSAWPDPSKTKEMVRLDIEEAIAQLPGNNYEFSQPIQMRFSELLAGVRGDLAVKVYGDEFETMVATAQDIAAELSGVPGAESVKVEQTEGLPVMNIDVDRHAAARYGLSISDVQEVIAIAIGGREAGQIFEGDRRFDLVVRLPDALRQDLVALENLPIPLPDAHEEAEGAGASFIPLSSVASIRTDEGPNQISRENGKRRVVVTANVRGRDLGGFVTEAKTRIESGVKLPAGVWLGYGGAYENLAAARERLAVVVPICFFLIFLLLFSTFNSVKYAVLVFSGVPLALTGGVIALWLRGMPFSISAAVGFIALSGVAVLNGLVMISYINHLRKEGMGLEDAIKQGSLTRLRPVLMTALVASLGFVPMALATGKGAEVQKPLATVVIGGIVTSTLLTLVVLPALYRMWHKRDDRLMHDEDEDHLVQADPNVG